MVKIQNRQTLIDGFSCIDIYHIYDKRLKQLCFELSQDIAIFYDKFMKLPDNEFSINDKYVVKNKLKFADERREHGYYKEAYPVYHEVLQMMGNALIQYSIKVKHEF